MKKAFLQGKQKNYARAIAEEYAAFQNEQGGNAVDAAVAVGFALGLVEPNATGLGGGGFMTMRSAETGEIIFLNFRECAPAAATPDMWQLGPDGKVIGAGDHDHLMVNCEEYRIIAHTQMGAGREGA